MTTRRDEVMARSATGPNQEVGAAQPGGPRIPYWVRWGFVAGSAALALHPLGAAACPAPVAIQSRAAVGNAAHARTKVMEPGAGQVHAGREPLTGARSTVAPNLVESEGADVAETRPVVATHATAGSLSTAAVDRDVT